MLFEVLRVWKDSVARSGPENMAVDEWLTTQTAEGPILRIYDWDGDWVSLGYLNLSCAGPHFDALELLNSEFWL